jgi:hypothetical protein
MNAVEIRPMEEEEFEDTKGVIRIRISKNGQKKKYKRTTICKTYT